MNGNKPKYKEYEKHSTDPENQTFSKKTAAAQIIKYLEAELKQLYASVISIFIIVLTSVANRMISVIIGIAAAVILAIRLRNVKTELEYLKNRYKIQ